MDLISVIIPCYNYSLYLDLCLLSVFTQKINCKVEVLLSDDNSSDESYGIAQRIALNYNSDDIFLSVFKQEKNLGEIENTKFLLSKCKGKYVAYLDADDYWIDPYKLQKQYDFMENNSDYSLCCTGQIMFNGIHHMPDPISNESIITPFFFIDSSKSLQPEDLIDNNFIFSSSRFFKNYDNLIKEYFNKFPYTDWPMNFELSLLGKVGYLYYASYVYRIKPDSLMHKEKQNHSNDEIERLKSERINILKSRLLEFRNDI